MERDWDMDAKQLAKQRIVGDWQAYKALFRKQDWMIDIRRLLIGCMAALLLIGSVFGMPVRIQASTELSKGMLSGNSVDGPKGVLSGNGMDGPKGGQAEALYIGMPVADLRTEFYPVEDLFYDDEGSLSLKKIRLKSIQPINNQVKNNQVKKLQVKKLQIDTSYSLSESAWASSGSDYYFSLLNTEEKKLYLNLKKQADRYLTGTDPFQVTQVARDGENVPVCILPLISYDGLTTAQMKKVFYCFMFENPQYYFMRNSVVYSENTGMMTVGLYEAFADGDARAAYTREFAGQLQAWDAQVDAAETVLEKEQLIHRLVCEHVTYDGSMAADDPDDKEMSQSCISAVLFDKKTVCAGYAQMFALLCGRAGITCVTVTSPGHAWNKIRMGGVWHNVDCTWDDCRGDDAFLNVTDGQLLAADTQLQEHALSEEWDGIAPSCTEALNPAIANGADAGANVPAPEKMSDTVALSNAGQGALAVSFAPMEGCDGYTVQYAANGAMLPADKVDMEEASCVIDGLASGETYYVRVRAYRWDSNGEKLYGGFSKKVKETVV